MLCPKSQVVIKVVSLWSSLCHKDNKKLLLTNLRRLKNTSKRRKAPTAVNYRIIKEPAAVNYRCDPTTNLAEALSSIIILILPKKIQISLKISKKSNQIFSTKSQVSNHNAINLHFSCYKCFFFSFWVDLIYFNFWVDLHVIIHF